MVRIVQVLSIVFLSFYVYITHPFYPDNLLWCIVALFLFVFGLFRKPYESMITTTLVLLVYGGFKLFQWYDAEQTIFFGWNDLLWLLIFPFSVLIGSLRMLTESVVYQEHRLSMFQQLSALDVPSEVEISFTDEHLGYISGTAFIYKLEEEVLRALRERREFALLIVNIEHFHEYKTSYGFEHSQLLLNQVAGFISNMETPPETKSHLGEGTFAILLPSSESETENPVMLLRNSLNEYFDELMLVRPRRENQIRNWLNYGVAICPADGIEARSLMDWAQGEIEGNEVRR